MTEQTGLQPRKAKQHLAAETKDDGLGDLEGNLNQFQRPPVVLDGGWLGTTAVGLWQLSEINPQQGNPCPSEQILSEALPPGKAMEDRGEKDEHSLSHPTGLAVPYELVSKLTDYFMKRLNLYERCGISAVSSTPGQTAGKVKATKGKDIAGKMMKTLSDDARSHDWTSVEWAKNLGCAEATIRGTKIWKVHLPKLHASLRVEGEGKMDDSVKRKRGRANPGQSHADD